VKQVSVWTTWALRGTSAKCVGVAEEDSGLVTGSSSESRISRIKRIANQPSVIIGCNGNTWVILAQCNDLIYFYCGCTRLVKNQFLI